MQQASIEPHRTPSQVRWVFRKYLGVNAPTERDELEQQARVTDIIARASEGRATRTAGDAPKFEQRADCIRGEATDDFRCTRPMNRLLTRGVDHRPLEQGAKASRLRP